MADDRRTSEAAICSKDACRRKVSATRIHERGPQFLADIDAKKDAGAKGSVFDVVLVGQALLHGLGDGGSDDEHVGVGAVGLDGEVADLGEAA